MTTIICCYLTNKTKGTNVTTHDYSHADEYIQDPQVHAETYF